MHLINAYFISWCCDNFLAKPPTKGHWCFPPPPQKKTTVQLKRGYCHVCTFSSGCWGVVYSHASDFLLAHARGKFAQCPALLNFQPPPEAGLRSIWDGRPVAFYSSSGYSCANDSLFFENNRSQAIWNMTCLPGGNWAVPATWPKCLPSIYTVYIFFYKSYNWEIIVIDFRRIFF